MKDQSWIVVFKHYFRRLKLDILTFIKFLPQSLRRKKHNALDTGLDANHEQNSSGQLQAVEENK